MVGKDRPQHAAPTGRVGVAQHPARPDQCRDVGEGPGCLRRLGRPRVPSNGNQGREPGELEVQGPLGVVDGERGRALVDADGDGKPDVLFGANDRKFRVLHGATGRELMAFDATVKGHVYEWIDSGPVVADFDGDGHDDILATDGTFYRGAGGGGFAAPVQIGFYGFGAAIGDFDRDGLPDAIGAFGSYPSGLAILRGKAVIGFDAPVVQPYSSYA